MEIPHISFKLKNFKKSDRDFPQVMALSSPKTTQTALLQLDIYPYLSYAIIAWGSACASHLKKIQVKQNHIVRLMFFATLYGKNTDSALPLHNLLYLLTVENIFTLQLFKFSHQW